MLCKKCERVIPENQTVCSYCGTSAVDILSEDVKSNKNNNQYSNRKRNRKKNKRNNITHINDAIKTEPAQSTTENPDKMPQKIKPEIETPQNMPEMPIAPKEQPQPEIPNPPVEIPKDIEVDTLSEIERVEKDSELPKPDNKRTLPDSSGIMYEIAEELYMKEKTASEIEALCQPPFKKVFSERQIEQLNEQAKEKARKLASSTIPEPKIEVKPEPEIIPEKEEPENKQNKSITTAGAFLLQLVFLIPIVNIITSMCFAFNKTANPSLKSYSRAFLIWGVIIMLAALVYFAVFYFLNPANTFFNIDWSRLFQR